MDNYKFQPWFVSGENYQRWIMDYRLRLKSNGIFGTVEKGNTLTEQDKTKVIVLMRTHLCDELKH